MIAAILANSIPVQVDNVLFGVATVISLGRENLDSHYVGGEGYKPVKVKWIAEGQLAEVAQFDPDNCDEYQNWIDAMRESDALADDRSPNTQAALDIENDARLKFIEFIHTNSVVRGTHAGAIAPNFPAFLPQMENA